MPILFGTIAGALLMLTVTGILSATQLIAIGIGGIIGLSLIGMQPIAKIINWRNER